MPARSGKKKPRDVNKLAVTTPGEATSEDTAGDTWEPVNETGHRSSRPDGVLSLDGFARAGDALGDLAKLGCVLLHSDLHEVGVEHWWSERSSGRANEWHCH